MSATNVEYGTVTMTNVVTREWNEELVYDATHTDVLMTKYSLSFEGILHVQSLTPASIYATGGANNVPGLYQLVQKQLETPRQRLIVKFGDTKVIDVQPMVANPKGNNYDVNSGPHPKFVSVRHIAGGHVLRVVFSIEASVVNCRDGSPGGLVLNNRWSISEAMDANFYMTRTIRGRVRFSGGGFHPGFSFKGLCIPGLEIGFRRESVDFTLDASGLEADYSVVDKQVETSAPWPATSISGSHTEGTSDGVNFFSEVNVHLEGPPHVDKRFLIVRAIQVAEARLKLTENLDVENANYLLEAAQVTDHIGPISAVDVAFRVKRLKDTGLATAHLITDTIGTPLKLPGLSGKPAKYNKGDSSPDYDPAVSYAPALHGYVPHGSIRDPAVLFLLHCYLQDPCAPPENHAIAQWSGGKTDRSTEKEEKYGTKITGYQTTTLPTEKLNAHSDSHQKAMYTMSRLESKYRLRHSRVHLPIAQRLTGTQIKASQNTSALLTLGLPLCQREIWVDAERVGQEPELPVPLDAYDESGISYVLLDHWVSVMPPTLSADATKPIRRVRAYYLYAMSRPPFIGENVAVGVLPFTSYNPGDTSFNSGKAYIQPIGTSPSLNG